MAELHRFKILLAVLFLLFLGMRLVNLEADAPERLSWSAGIWGDEGSYAAPARDLVLFGGQPENYAYIPEVTSRPLSTMLNYAAFLAMGVGYAQVRLMSVLLSVLTLFVFYLLLRNSLGRGQALLSTALLGLNFVFTMYSRLALDETKVLFFLVLAVYAWQSLNSQKPGKAPLAALLAAAVFLLALQAKFMAFVFLPALLLLAWFSLGNLITTKRAIFCAAAFVLAGAVLCVFLQASPYNFSHLVGGGAETLQNMPRNIIAFFANYAFRNAPLTALTGFAALLLVVRKWFSDRKSVPQIMYVFAAWVIGGGAIISMLSYQPPRYLLLLFPAIAALAGYLLFRIGSMSKQKNYARHAATALLILILFWDIGNYAAWALNPQYQVVNASRDLKQYGGAVAGAWSTALCMETDLRCYLLTPSNFRDREQVEALGVKYLLLEKGDEDYGIFTGLYPQLPEGGGYIKTYDMHGHKIELYRIRD